MAGSSSQSARRSLRIDLDGFGGSVYGTKDDYAALIASLSRALESPATNAVGQSILEPDVETLLAPESDLPDFTFYLVDTVPPREASAPAEGGRNVGWFIFAALVLVIVFAALGLAAVINYLS